MLHHRGIWAKSQNVSRLTVKSDIVAGRSFEIIVVRSRHCSRELKFHEELRHHQMRIKHPQDTINSEVTQRSMIDCGAWSIQISIVIRSLHVPMCWLSRLFHFEDFSFEKSIARRNWLAWKIYSVSCNLLDCAMLNAFSAKTSFIISLLSASRNEAFFINSIGPRAIQTSWYLH